MKKILSLILACSILLQPLIVFAGSVNAPQSIESVTSAENTLPVVDTASLENTLPVEGTTTPTHFFLHHQNDVLLGVLAISPIAHVEDTDETLFIWAYAPLSGSRTSGDDGTWNYQWDYRNQLQRATTSSALSSFGYDYTGQRVFLKGANLATTTIPSKLYSTSSATTTKHIYAGNQLVATVETAGATTTIAYIHSDHLGGTSAITNDHRDLLQVADYYPFGSLRFNSQYAEFNERRKYIGEQYDDNTALSYLNARYYNGTQGRLLSQDPVFWENQNLENPQSLNSYSYAENNPILRKDQSGRCSQCLIGAGAGIVGQYGYDVFNNIQSNGFSVSAFYSNLSSPGTYITRAGQGALVALTGGAAGALTTSIAGQAVAVGVASGLIGAGGNYLLGQPIAPESVAIDTILGGLTYGAVQSAPRVRGLLPEFGTKAFYMGRHTQQSVLNLGIDAAFGYVGSTLTDVASYRSEPTVYVRDVQHTQSDYTTKTYTTPSGAVVDWGGNVISGPSGN